MTEVQIFNSVDFGDVKAIEDTENNPWFCLADICRALELNNPSAVKQRLRKKGVQLIDNHTLFLKEEVKINELGKINTATTYIDEANMYRCVFQSRKKTAEKFQDWMFEEVIPLIRKKGGYIVSHEGDTEQDILARAILIAQNSIGKLKEEKAALSEGLKAFKEENETQKEIIKEQEPQVLFAKAVTTSKKTILVGELSKLLQQSGIKIGQNKLFMWLRKNGYLGNSGDYYNIPTQRAMNMELFEINTITIQRADNWPIVKKSVRVTGKGQIYFINKFIKEYGRTDCSTYRDSEGNAFGAGEIPSYAGR